MDGGEMATKKKGRSGRGAKEALAGIEKAHKELQLNIRDLKRALGGGRFGDTGGKFSEKGGKFAEKGGKFAEKGGKFAERGGKFMEKGFKFGGGGSSR
jgi:hypothetical protein